MQNALTRARNQVVRVAAAVALAVVALATPVAAPAARPTPFVPEPLLAAARANPTSTFRVLVQGRGGASSHDVATAVHGAGAGHGVRRSFRAISGVSAEITGAQLVRLANLPAVLAITPDAAVAPTDLLGPTATTPPTISGSAVDGQTLAADDGAWTGATPTTTRRWQRCAAAQLCVDVPGATGSSYAVTGTDVGSALRVVVTATDSTGTSDAPSAATAVVTAAAPTLVSTPTVDGTPAEGATLTAGGATWAGTAPLAVTYAWRACDATGATCTDLVGATGSSYLVGALDVGSTLRVAVTATNAAGTATATSDATAAVSAAAVPPPPPPPAPAATPPSVATAPSVAGSPAEGSTLTASAGTWTGDAPVALAYQWRRCDATGAACVDLAAATGATYVLVAADAGATIRVAVTASNAAGSATATSDATAAIAPAPAPPSAPAAAPPSASTAPSVTGDATDGATLTASPGTWSGDAPIALAYQWQRCDATGAACVDVGAATAVTYTLSGADAGTTLRVAVTATNAAGAATIASGATAPIASAPTQPPAAGDNPPSATAAPSVGGDAAEGAVLTASPGTWTGDAPIALAYQWRRCDATGAACVDLAGATAATYTATAADAGATLRVAVTATNAVSSATVASAPTAAIAAAPAPTPPAPPIALAASTPPAVGGDAREGAALTVTAGTWTATPTAVAYRWQRCFAASCADVAGATAATYAPTVDDVGAQLRVVATATGATGTASSTSTPTATVAASGPLSNDELWPYATRVAQGWNSTPAPAIAIVDSGVDASRADFGGRVVDQETFTSLTPNSPGDGRGHGTLAASIAAGGAAGHVGAAPTARIVSLDVMNDEGRALTSDVVAALDWIYANKDQYDIRVANLSLQATAPTSLRYDPIDKEVEKLWLSGVVVVSAAGNYAVDGARSDVRFGPANDPFGIAVGAVDLAGTVPAADDFAAPWSAYGHTLDGFSKPDLAAPGRAIVAAVPPDSTLVAQYPDRVTAPGYMWMSGTSFAAPVVSGVAADLLAAHPDWTPDQVKGALMLSARATAAAPGSVGVGEVDAAAATAVTAPPNPNKALEHFVVTDPTGATGPVFDAEAWGTAAAADPAWAAEAWGTEAWGTAYWSAEAWGTAYWSAEAWGTEAWGTEAWGTEAWGTELHDGAASDTR